MFRNLSTVGLPLSGRPSELIELALSFGFDGMDIDIVDFQRQADIFGVEHARRLMVSARLKSGVFQLPVTLAADEGEFKAEMAELPRRLELAKATELSRAVVPVAPASEEHSFKDFFELHRTRLHAIGDMAAKEGIQIGLVLVPETDARAGKALQFIHTYEGLLGLVAVSHPAVGVVVDGWAFAVTGEPLDMIAKVPAARIVEVRISDAPREVPGGELHHGQRLMPGETGVIDCAAILGHARDAGFDGPVTPWADRATLAGRGREKIVRLAGDRLDAAWRGAGLPIVPRWFTPVAREPGRPGEEGVPAPVPATGAVPGRAPAY
jgi:sugar phosphate isomerase/epimerase